MAIKLAQAKLWCTSDELALVKSSMRPMIGELSVAELKQSIKRAQRLENKWVKLSRDQNRRVQQDKGYRRGGGSERSNEKAQLFSEVLEAFKAKLEAKTAKPKAAAKPAVTKPPVVKPAVAPKAAKRKKPAVPSLISLLNATSAPGIQLNKARQIKASTAGKAFRFKVGGLVRTQRHSQSRNKRNQARRDSRPR